LRVMILVYDITPTMHSLLIFLVLRVMIRYLHMILTNCSDISDFTNISVQDTNTPIVASLNIICMAIKQEHKLSPDLIISG
jgi:hypothetical protein